MKVAVAFFISKLLLDQGAIYTFQAIGRAALARSLGRGSE